MIYIPEEMSSFKVDTLAEVTILHVKDVLSFVAKREEKCIDQFSRLYCHSKFH